MATQEQITYIMQELGLDPNSADQRKVVERLAASKPNVPIDDRFIALLREDIQSQANHMAELKSNKNNNLFSNFMNKILASALVVAIVAIAGGVWYIQRSDKPLFQSNGSEQASQLLSGKYAVTDAEEESFGDLGKVAIVSGRGGGNGSNLDTATQQSNNSVNSLGTPENMGDKMAPNSSTSESPVSILPFPQPTNYTFKYTGEDLGALPETQGVIKRMKPVQPASLVDRIVSFLSFGLIDMSKFQNMKIQNFTFAEDRDYGYSISADLVQGSVGIYQNFERWPDLYAGGNPPPRINPEDLPSDEEAIRIADQFLSDYNVSKDGYGTPRVQDAWRVQYERLSEAERQAYYIPEQVQVIYPLVIEGQEVMDESGFSNGLTLTVDARTKRVVNVYDLSTKQYERSEYQGETSVKRILDIAERGGFRNYPYTISGAKTTELQLDTPTTEMVKIWYSTDNYRTNNEVFVPALVFPIKNWKETGYWRQNVIVPLVSDILDSDKDPGQPIPLDSPAEPAMPVEPDGGNGSSGTSSGSAGASAGAAVNGAAIEPAVLPTGRG